MIKKIVDEYLFLLSDDQLKNRKEVSIFYTSNTYRMDVAHINNLAQAIMKDYPKLKYSNMKVSIISPKISNRNADKLAIEVLIPVEDFIKLKET